MRRVPKISEVAAALREIALTTTWSDLEPEEEGGDIYLDVRLQMYKSGSWNIRIGDPQYDTDHRGLWAEAVLWPSMAPEDYRSVARDLVGQIIEQVE